MSDGVEGCKVVDRAAHNKLFHELVVNGWSEDFAYAIAAIRQPVTESEQAPTDEQERDAA